VSGPDLLIFGSLTLDNVRTAEGVLLPQSCGGNAVYAALGARLWHTGTIGVVSRAGANYPAAFLAELERFVLDLGGIARLDRPHGLNVAFCYRADGSRARIFPAEVMAAIPPHERARFTDHTAQGPEAHYTNWIDFSPSAADIPAAWKQPRGAHLPSMPVQCHASIARALRAADAWVQVDSPWFDARDLAADHHTALLADIDVLLPSEADLLVWRPHADPLATAAALAQGAGRRVLVKQGAAGCTLVGPDGRMAWHMPALPVTARDPTGAGDTFCGGFLAGWARHGDLRQAALCGTVAASFAVEQPGLQGIRAATPAQLAERCTALQRMTQ
jgi:ribokinase